MLRPVFKLELSTAGCMLYPDSWCASVDVFICYTITHLPPPPPCKDSFCIRPHLLWFCACAQQMKVAHPQRQRDEGTHKKTAYGDVPLCALFISWVFVCIFHLTCYCVYLSFASRSIFSSSLSSREPFICYHCLHFTSTAAFICIAFLHLSSAVPLWAPVTWLALLGPFRLLYLCRHRSSAVL